MMATHIPLSVTGSPGKLRISGHLAAANEQAQALEAGLEAMAIFAAPHAYISPDHYEPGKWVPTWNYVAVHAYGTPVVTHDRAAKLAILAESIAAHDPGFQAVLDSYPTEFVDGRLKGIVAFEFEVTRLDARWKLSQDRKPVEQERISLAMRLSSDPSANRLAEYMDHGAAVRA
jgi:transcriptional regulator